MPSVLSRLTPLVLLLAAAAPLRAQAPTPRVELSADQWREDLAFMAAEMERRHHDLYHSVDRQTFAAAVADLHQRIPQLQRNEVIVGLMRLAAMIGDGHTRVDPRKDPRFGFPSLPLRLYLFDDGLYVRAAASEQAGLVGARIEAIGGVPVQEAMRRVDAIISRDNESGARLFVPLYLNMPDVLHALGLSDRRDSVELTLSRDDRTWTATVPAGAVEPLWPPDTDISLVTPEGWVDARRTPRPPLWLRAPLDYHRMVDLPDRRALYVQLNMVTDLPDQSLARFGEAIAQRVAATHPRALVLDLRLNHGGNGDLRNRFVRSLIRAEDEDTRLFILTWRGTFSASQFLLDDLDRLTDAVIIGEPAGSRPSSHGDAYRTELPNSGISIRSSIYWWQAGQNRDPWTWVDVAAPLAFADYVAGRDPALEAALDYAPPVPLAERLTAAVRAGGVDAVAPLLDAYLTDPANRYADLARALVRAALDLNAAGGRAEAFAAASYAAEHFPEDVDAALVLAVVAEGAGRIEVARRESDRVLALDPNNRFVRSLRARLGPR
jgi:hypothetical protein